MSTVELIELAILDAYGLLDESEVEAFDAAFAAAAPSVQAQVRSEQTRLAALESMLPKVAPPAELRAAVLKAVRAEIEAERAEAPLAPRFMPTHRVSPLWRAAALGFATAALILGGVSVYVQMQHRELQRMLTNDALIAAMSERLGEAHVQAVLFDPDTRRVVLKPDGEGFAGEASVFMNPEWQQAKFFCRGIDTPAGRSLRLALVDDSGNIVQVLSDFTSDGELFSRDVPLSAAMTGQLAILEASPDGMSATRILSRGSLSRSTM